MLRSAALALFAAALPVAALASAPAPTLAHSAFLAPQDLSAVSKAALAKARELAAWADEAGYGTGRDAMYEAVLAFDPDDKDARKALGYSKRKGEWVAGRRKEPVDDCEQDVPARFAELRRAALAELRAEVARAFEGLEVSPQVAQRRRAELARLVPFDPDDAALRAELGEVRAADGGAWVLAETTAAAARRGELAQALAELREGLAEPRESAADEYARGMDLQWTATLSLGRMTLVGTVPPEDARRLIETAQLVRELFSRVFPRAGAPGYPTVLYVVEPSERRRFFEQHPLTPEGELDYRAQITSSWLQGRLVVSSPGQTLRNDVTAFQTAGYALTEKFEVWTDDGWAQQGLCSYLASQVSGTRLSFWDIQVEDEYGKKKGGAKNWLERVPPSTDGWLAEAARLVADGQTIQQFARALTAPTANMTWEDVVTAHAVSAYLVEARVDDLVAILKRTAKGEQVVRCFEDQLGMPLGELRERLVRWIAERAALEEAAAAANGAGAPSEGAAPEHVAPGGAAR